MGCAAKVSRHVLADVLARLSIVETTEIQVGVSTADDAAVFRMQGAIVQSVDLVRAMVDDPWLLGQVAAEHALNDLYAMLAKPETAQAVLTLPYASEQMQLRELQQLMQGALSVFDRIGCTLVGGHSAEGDDYNIGFVVNGSSATETGVPGQPLAGDVIITTKAIGTGVVLAAQMRSVASGYSVKACLQSMLRGHAEALPVLKRFAVRGITDISGFGVYGHLERVLLGAGLGAKTTT